MNMLFSLLWYLMVLEFIIFGVVIFFFICDLFFKLNYRYVVFGVIVVIVLVIVLLIILYSELVGDILNGLFVLDGFLKGFKMLLLGVLVFILCIVMSDDKKNLIEDKGEYYYLFLMVFFGVMFMVFSVDFIIFFVGLELFLFFFYILVGI